MQNQQTNMDKQVNNIVEGRTSPLYGEGFQLINRDTRVDTNILHEPPVLSALDTALDIYVEQLDTMGYSRLTINSYTSAVNRFFDFLKLGEVIPSYEDM